MWMRRGDRDKNGKEVEKRMKANLKAAAVMGIDMYSRLNGLIDHVEKEAKLKLQ
jgi:5S rRNA maturation endonuclease (ribonuclease M5)